MSSFGAGGVSPGLYHSLGAGNAPCEWSREGQPGESGGATVFTPHLGPIWAQIHATDTKFENRGCLTFWQEPGPWAKQLTTPGEPFGQGDFKVGYEIAPGTYTAPGGNPEASPPGRDCKWARLNSFDGALVPEEVPEEPATAADDAVIRLVDASVIEMHEYGRDGTTGDIAGPQTVTIERGDYGFTSQGCGTWEKVES